MKNENLEIKVNRKQVFRESTDDLNHLKVACFATKEEIKNTEFIHVKILDTDIDSEDYSYASYSYDVKISEIKNLIEKAEQAGANFIAIDYHGGSEYDIYGFNLERVSPEELEAFENEKVKREKAQKANRIARLEERLKKLKEE